MTTLREIKKRRLIIKEYVLSVRLGCETWERKVPQEVRVSIEVEFLTPPLGEKTDRLEETICYAEICELIRTISQKKEYQLVEHLFFEIQKNLKTNFPGYVFKISTHKLNPPVEGLTGGVIYVGGF